ncbi:MAG: hydrogenase maturation protease [bacterium]|nr:hydrogenase maturation protease [bacterium]
MQVIAVGNAFCGDDGVGAAVLAQLAAVLETASLRLADLGTDALALVEMLRADEPCVVVDAARMGQAPGTVAAFRPREARLRIRGDGLSLHGLGLAEAFALAGQLGRMPADLLVVGVEPAGVTPGTGLSDAVAAAVPRVVQIIQAEVQRHE